jgi:hypothetical protein
MNTSKSFFVLLTTLLLSPGLLFAGAPSTSGFFEQSIDFEKHPDRRNTYRYIKKDLDLGNYDKVAIAPVEIWIDPDSPYKGVQANGIKAMSDRLRQVMVAELQPDYPVVTRAGSRTVGLRLAVTGVKMKKKKRGFFSYMPIGVAAAAVQDDMLNKTMLSDAIIEADLIDTQTGERIAALVDRNMAADLSGNKHEWKEIEEVFDYYAKRFRKSLDESR